MKRRTCDEWLSDLQNPDPNKSGQAWQDLFETLIVWTVYPYLRVRCGGIPQVTGDLQGYAEQITQESLLKIYQGLALKHRYQRQRGSFLTWATSIARHTAADVLRKEVHRISLSLDDVVETALASVQSLTDSEPLASTLDCQDFVRRVLEDDLSEAQREACILKYYYGYKIREIAEIMTRSEKAVENLLHEARKKFRRRAAEERIRF